MLLFTSLKSVVDCGALEALVICLEEFDPGVKESAAWALGYIARHNTGKIYLCVSCLNLIMAFVIHVQCTCMLALTIHNNYFSIA